MELFDKAESKYYEAVVKALYDKQKKENITQKTSDLVIANLAPMPLDENDYDGVMAKKDMISEDFYVAFNPTMGKNMDAHLPKIRTTIIERQALKNMSNNKDAELFLGPETRRKLAEAVADVETDWDDSIINVKNRNYVEKNDGYNDEIREKLEVISEAIRVHKAIQYGYVKNSRSRCNMFPVRIEYSYVNDRFRILGYQINCNKQKPITLRLDQTFNISLNENLDTPEEWIRNFADNREAERKIAFIDISVENNDKQMSVVDRCFRIFSAYDREAFWIKETNTYRMKVYYSDEKELERDILSVGRHAYIPVFESIDRSYYGIKSTAKKWRNEKEYDRRKQEQDELRQHIIERIKGALNNYTGDTE